MALYNITPFTGDGDGGGAGICIHLVVGIALAFMTYCVCEDISLCHSLIGRIIEVVAVLIAFAFGPMLLLCAIVLGVAGAALYYICLAIYNIGHWIICG